MVYINPAELTSDRGDIDATRHSNRLETGSAAQSHAQFGLGTTIKRLLLVSLVAIFFSANCLAQDGGWYPHLTRKLDIETGYVYSSLYTRHYDPDPDHVNDQNMLGLEFETRNRRVFGLSIFDNSFGQDSEYLYAGYKFRAFESDRWYYKITGGLIHGYRGEYKDKIPLNEMGVAPVIIPSIGVQHKNFVAEFSQLGLAAGMITAGAFQVKKKQNAVFITLASSLDSSRKCNSKHLV